MAREICGYAKANRNVLAAFAFGALCIYEACFGELVQRWTVETSEIAPYELTAYHGETFEMHCQMLSYGRPLSGCGNAVFMWQTNGMGNAWWQTNATFASGWVKVKWSPDMDAMESKYAFFFRVTDRMGQNYRANGTMSLLGSPSGNVRQLPLPTDVLDFAEVRVLNPGSSPFELKGGSASVSTGEVNALIGAYDRTNLTGRLAMKQNVVVDLETIRVGAAKGMTALQGYVETDPRVGLTNGVIWIKGGSVRPLTSHQSLAMTNDFARKGEKVAWGNVTNAPPFVGKEVTNGLASASYVDGTASAIRSEMLTVEKDPTVGLTNGVIWIHGDSVKPLTEHQPLGFTNDYVRIGGKVAWSAVTNAPAFVTGTVTNGLAGTGYVNAAVSPLEYKRDMTNLFYEMRWQVPDLNGVRGVIAFNGGHITAEYSVGAESKWYGYSYDASATNITLNQWGPSPSVGEWPSSVVASKSLEIRLALSDQEPTAAERAAWNGKYEKPAGGIGTNDLAASVSEAVASVAGKRDETNRVWRGTAWIAPILNGITPEVTVLQGEYLDAAYHGDGFVLDYRGALPTGGTTAVLAKDGPEPPTGIWPGSVTAEYRAVRFALDTEIPTEGDRVRWDGKQNVLTGAQASAVSSGITAARVAAYDGYGARLDAKRDMTNLLWKAAGWDLRSFTDRPYRTEAVQDSGFWVVRADYGNGEMMGDIFREQQVIGWDTKEAAEAATVGYLYTLDYRSGWVSNVTEEVRLALTSDVSEPGNYLAVSNRAMGAVQSLDEATNYTDAVAWELRGEMAGIVPGNYETVSNRAMGALQAESDPTVGVTNGAIWVKGVEVRPVTRETVSNVVEDVVGGRLEWKRDRDDFTAATEPSQWAYSSDDAPGSAILSAGAYVEWVATNAPGASVLTNGWYVHADGAFVSDDEGAMRLEYLFATNPADWRITAVRTNEVTRKIAVRPAGARDGYAVMFGNGGELVENDGRELPGLKWKRDLGDYRLVTGMSGTRIEYSCSWSGSNDPALTKDVLKRFSLVYDTDPSDRSWRALSSRESELGHWECFPAEGSGYEEMVNLRFRYVARGGAESHTNAWAVATITRMQFGDGISPFRIEGRLNASNELATALVDCYYNYGTKSGLMPDLFLEPETNWVGKVAALVVYSLGSAEVAAYDGFAAMQAAQGDYSKCVMPLYKFADTSVLTNDVEFLNRLVVEKDFRRAIQLQVFE